MSTPLSALSSGPVRVPTEPAPATPDATEARAFERFVRANDALESGGRCIPSRLVTTAGPGAPASYGRTQLLVSLQVNTLRELGEGPGGARTLATYGLDRATLDAMDARGRAAHAYYDAVVRGRLPEGMEPAQARALVAAGRAGDEAALVGAHGEAFAAATGLPPEALGELAQTRRLRDPAVVRDALARRPRTDEALDRFVARHPSLEPVRARLGDASFAYFITHPHRSAEHRGGWYTRAAQSVPGGYAALVSALERGADARTSAARVQWDHRTATALVDAVLAGEPVEPARRARLVAQLARLAHGSPAFLAARVGRPGAPRLHGADALEGFLHGLERAPAGTLEGDRGASLRAFRAAYDR